MCCNEKKEEKWKEIPVSEARVGDEVFSVLRGWGEIQDIVDDMHDRDLLVRWPARSIRKARKVVKEMWGLRSQYETDNTVHHVRFDTQKEAEEHRDAFKFARYIIPCRVTWEVEE